MDCSRLFIALAISLALVSGRSSDEALDKREKKLLSIFQVIRFNNDVCAASNSRNGTCYTAIECENRDGTNGGSCAGGFGVCCVFAHSCGESSSENNTYFTTPTTGVPTMGDCVLSVCPTDPNICQLRLDFEQLSITGPSTSQTAVLTTIAGQPTSLFIANMITAAPVSTSTQCLTDTFTVSNPGGGRSPTLCGILTNDHMYIDASEACNDLAFTFGTEAIGTTLRPRTWNIKVSQYSCDYENLAPRGCTQYFFGQGGSGTLRSFNFAGGMHLANQQQSICIRRERTFCRVCYYTTIAADFALSGLNNQGRTNANICCGYGEKGQSPNGYDCLQILGAVKDDGMPITRPPAISFLSQHGNSRFCGRSEGLVQGMGGGTATICSTREPFQVNLYTDNFEFVGENTVNNQAKIGGVQVQYFQDAMLCQ